jgi:hypothetical protein
MLLLVPRVLPLLLLALLEFLSLLLLMELLLLGVTCPLLVELLVFTVLLLPKLLALLLQLSGLLFLLLLVFLVELGITRIRGGRTLDGRKRKLLAAEVQIMSSEPICCALCFLLPDHPALPNCFQILSDFASGHARPSIEMSRTVPMNIAAIPFEDPQFAFFLYMARPFAERINAPGDGWRHPATSGPGAPPFAFVPLPVHWVRGRLVQSRHETLGGLRSGWRGAADDLPGGNPAAVKFAVGIVIGPQRGAFERGAGEDAARAGVRQDFRPHIRVGVGLCTSSDGTRGRGNVAAELDLTLQEAFGSAIIHDEKNEIRSFGSQLKTETATLERHHRRSAPRSGEIAPGAANHGATTVAAAHDEGGLENRWDDDNAARPIQDVLRNRIGHL